MQVQQINNATTFNGKSAKSFRRYIKELRNQRIDEIYKATPEGQRVDTKELDKVEATAKQIQKSVDDFMSKFHPKTRLAKDSTELLIVNPIGGRCHFTHCDVVDGQLQNNFIFLLKSMPTNIDSLAQFAKDLSEKVNPKNVEQAIFDDALAMAESNAKHEFLWLQRFMVRRDINSIFKYKDITGVKSDITKESLLDKVNQIFFDHKIARHNAKEVKRVTKQNKKTVDSYKL